MKRICIGMIVILIVPWIAGGSFSLEVRPVAGPLIALGITPPIRASFELSGNGHGKVAISMPGDEVCCGEYTIMNHEQQYSAIFSPVDYIRYYGNRFSTKNLKYGQATVYGNKGTIVYAEFYVNFWHHYGLAKDNKDNVYKLE